MIFDCTFCKGKMQGQFKTVTFKMIRVNIFHTFYDTSISPSSINFRTIQAYSSLIKNVNILNPKTKNQKTKQSFEHEEGMFQNKSSKCEYRVL